MGIKDNPKETHESYGIIKISRVTGGNQHFFGTAINQQHYFELVVAEGAKEVTEFGDERFSRNNHRIPFLRLKLTAHQFTEMITTMNTGDGVPCTIAEREYVDMEQCPPQKSPLDAVIEKAHEGVKRTEDFIHQYLTEINELVNQPTLTKKDRETVKQKIGIIFNRMKENTDFYSRQIEEVGEKVVTQAKTEIEAVISHKIHQFGLSEIERIKTERLTKSETKEICD